jgi:hypothetical protein
MYPKENIAEVNAQSSPAEVLRQILDILIPVQKAHYERVREREKAEAG